MSSPDVVPVGVRLAVERWIVEPEAAGERLDLALARRASVGSRAAAKKVLLSGKVFLEGRPVGGAEGGRPVVAGWAIEIRWTLPGTGARRVAGREALERAGVVIVHQDEALVVVDKPAGLLTDAADEKQAREQDTLRKRVRAYLGLPVVWPVHRLDRDTTGLVAFALNPQAREDLKAQWATRSPRRLYLALAWGQPKANAGEWRSFMRWDRALKIQRTVGSQVEGAQPARSVWRVVERYRLGVLLEVQLDTGRRNQIRLHASEAGHPLVGDGLYRGQAAPPFTFERQALHHHQLGLLHPVGAQPMVWTSPLPSDLVALKNRLNQPIELRTGNR